MSSKIQFILAKSHPVTDALQPAGPLLRGWGLKSVSPPDCPSWNLCRAPAHSLLSSYNLALLLHRVCLVWVWMFVLVSCLVPLFPSENEILPWIPADLDLAGQALFFRDWIVAHLPSHSLLQTTPCVWRKYLGEEWLCLVPCCLSHA